MPSGLLIWNAANALVFDTTSIAGRYAGTLVLTGPAQGNFAITGMQAGNQAWIDVQYYNVPVMNLQDALVKLINATTISYDVRYLPAGAITHVHYGWK
jgi:hypothetical protein